LQQAWIELADVSGSGICRERPELGEDNGLPCDLQDLGVRAEDSTPPIEEPELARGVVMDGGRIDLTDGREGVEVRGTEGVISNLRIGAAAGGRRSEGVDVFSLLERGREGVA